MNLLLAISNAIATDANLTAIAARIKTIMTSVVSPVLVVIGAACEDGQNHNQAQRQSKNLLHFHSPYNNISIGSPWGN